MNNTDNQYLDLIGDTYKNYVNYPLATVHNHRTNILYQNMDKGWCMINGRSIISPHPTRHLTQEEFINKIKIDDEFAKQWGLTIEVRELSQEERFKIAYKNLELRKKLESESAMLHYPSGHSKVMDDANIPTRAISLTYNDKTIESYE
jgi:hypothetical protein